jgi:hypothetical protein
VLDADQPGHRDPDEYVAEVFAAFLLMSKSAVDRAFAVRNITPAAASQPPAVFEVKTSRAAVVEEYQPVFSVWCPMRVGRE